ncbi:MULTISPECIES: cbb3-type cytochrome oxidase subunit 3 [Amniculibacterium]|uniref:cbb3-type cytochrome oxidase subunit 3 n=1 Tax=Amniculibacterium TaxID=2715289 RepID=UPI000F596707|nr:MULTISPECIES: cbb3-type cytochrome c oxidase subunit 3 [Amniculibacterium]
MIPQSFRDILSNGENSNLFQIIALLIFIVFFVGLIIYVFSRPKKYYDEEANAPLDDDSDINL